MTAVLSKSLELFGDKLFIKHTPLMHQEGLKTCSSYVLHR
jgi:hypothetical protein